MEHLSGFISIMGNPNVGKSTLMNALVGEKVAIVTQKAQTTRNKVVGILTKPNYQIIFLDTPGLHTPHNKLGEYMVKTAYDANKDVDLTIMVIDGVVGILQRDEEIFQKLNGDRFLVLINKIDAVKPEKVKQLIEKVHALGVAKDAVCTASAKQGWGLEELERKIVSYLQPGPQYYPEDMVTDRPERFLASELIREKALLSLREEIPHGIGVEIEKVEEQEGLTNVSAVIYCERDSHKGIIIGKKGAMLKKIGSEARGDLEMLFGTKVFLQLWVKVKEDWRNSGFMLKTLGYRD